ncbi:zinc finger protein 260-like [Chaetodon trifascialis]|uniref:zinc finger protein 260-like n=1 Tax=Chaetodon trifascialis TaxID=109706 RepID=UPI003994A919
MSKVQTLRAFVKQRLTAAAEEKFELFERTIAEYEEELCRQRKLLDAVLKPEVRLHRADVQLLSASQEEDPPEQQEWSPSLDQEDPAELPHIKEEQEELWTSQEGERLPGPEEADITKSTFPPVPVKSEEEDEEKPHSSQLHLRHTEDMKTEGDGEDCGGPEPSRSSDPDRHLEPDTDDETSQSSEPETDDSCDWEETREPRSDVQLLLASQEEDPPEQQEWSPSLDQEDPAELPHIKEEQEELWTSQEGERLPGPEEADITMSTFPPVPVKSEEEDEEKPHCSQLHQRHTEDMKTEGDGEDCGGPEPSRSSDPDRHLEPDTDDETSRSSEPETDDSCDWEETREPRSGLKPLQNNEVPVSDVKCNTGQTSVSSSECASSFDHSGVQAGEKPFSCSVCGKRYQQKSSLTSHMRLHSEGKYFSCSVCEKTFPQRGMFMRHMRIHTGEKPFSCSVCGLRFRQKAHLSGHSTVHTGHKPFSCSVCGKRFAQKHNLMRHSTVHSGDKPFSCSICGKRFELKGSLTKHMRLHSIGKRFSCSVCEKTFYWRRNVVTHMRIHTGEKPFSCSVCGLRFRLKDHLRQHSTVHTGEKPFSCSVCKESFKFRSSLSHHMSKHIGEKPFSCFVCGERFQQKAILRRHLTVHTG